MAPSFTFEGRDIPFQAGDTLASAIHRAGVRVLSRSFKYHRPRGLYCCTGSCAGCTVAVDGVPNLTACTVAAAPGARVESQNRIGSAKHDALAVVDKVYRRGFDPHAAFTRPRVLNQAFLAGVRFVSGVGRVPDGEAAARPAPPRPRRHVHEVDEVVVGAGRLGLARAKAAAREGARIVVVDEAAEPGGSLRWNPGEADTADLAAAASVDAWPGVQTWTQATAFGVYRANAPSNGAGQASAGGPTLTVGVARGGDLHELHTRRVTLATGRHDDFPLFVNNDLPGVLSLRGATLLLRRHGVLPGRRIVGHGLPLPDDFVQDVRAAGGEVVAQGNVEQAHGGTEVEAATVDGRRVACDAIVCAIPGTPRIELAQQAGCSLSFDNPFGGLAPVTDDSGRTSRGDVFALFSRAEVPA